MTTRTDAQMDQRDLTRAFRSLIGLRSILALMGTGIGTIVVSTLYLSHNWEDVKGDVKSQGQTLQIHDNLIRNQGSEIQNINIHFARIEQLILDLQNGRKTSLRDLPSSPMAGSVRASDFPSSIRLSMMLPASVASVASDRRRPSLGCICHACQGERVTKSFAVE